MAKTIRDFMIYRGVPDNGEEKHPDLKDKMGVIIRNEACGGVFRGHVDLWFGEMNGDGSPRLVQVFAGFCELVPDEKIPIGE